ncbi:SMODS-associated NUDIX domain-containing protein [Pedobacter cryophilus]|uniref:CD-NTase-associated protein 16 NUDIX domain-containing protein n=1 Tax=Pedobacter cryophilus TaxID=2571271 RepID=A0A4U1C462_9SPHI|nr:hypothetical protein [Pedobacter cryophilus]TKB99146.1 hypothetical protein FA046_08545 [Pedobacter cryophilus]
MQEIFKNMGAIFALILKQAFTKGTSVLWENRGFVQLYLKTTFGKYKDKEIRFSLSYLIKIQIPETDKYLLVLNRRIDKQLQPVGGVYKRHGDDRLFNSWDYRPDTFKKGLGTDTISNQDLRFRIPGKHAVKAIKWFEEGKEREISINREFDEELINTKILDEHIFKNINYKHLKRFSKNLVWSEYHNCYEILIYDIFEFLPSQEQALALKDLNKIPNNLANGYAIVECDQIEQLRYCEDNHQLAKIGHHTKLIINQKF